MKVHYRIYKGPSPVPFLSQISPVYASLFNFMKIYFNIIFLFMPRSPKWSLSITFPCMHFSSSPHLLRAPHIAVVLITRMIFVEEYGTSIISKYLCFLRKNSSLFLKFYQTRKGAVRKFKKFILLTIC